MKIRLEEPYKSLWKHGYLVESQGRRSVVLVNTSSDRTTTSYARYLMSVYIGRLLTNGEHVDHINNDKYDDRVDNLQILTLKENNKKRGDAKNKQFAVIKCPNCKTVFECRVGNCQVSNSKKGMVKCCSRECANVFKKNKITKEKRRMISESSVIRIIEKNKTD